MRFWLAWWLFPLLPLALAQEYAFQAVKTPRKRQIQTLYAFYVFSQEESPAEQHRRPSVEFNNFHAHPSTTSSQSSESPKTYDGFRLSIVEFSEMNNTLSPQQVCTGDSHGAHGGVDVFTHVLSYSDTHVGSQSTVKFELRKTGVYILVLSNCGDMDGGEVHGSVLVKNSYGFLPGNEYHKLPFYGWLWFCYVLLTLVWVGLCWAWKENVQQIQNCIYYVLLFGILEAFMRYVFFKDWNTTGNRDQIYFAAAVVLASVKAGWSYMLLLAVSLGWGVTHPTLDPPVLCKVKVLCVFYIGLTCVKEGVMSFRHSSSLPVMYGALSVLPMSVLNGAVFYWIFTSFAALVETLRERKLERSLRTFTWFWRILLLTLGVASSTLLFETYDLSRAEHITTRWRYQWLTQDGVTQGLFLFVVIAAMFLWAPHRLPEVHGYEPTARDRDEDEERIVVDSDQEASDGAGGESTHALPKMTPSIVGAPTHDDV